jgi:hypothetical protein
LIGHAAHAEPVELTVISNSIGSSSVYTIATRSRATPATRATGAKSDTIARSALGWVEHRGRKSRGDDSFARVRELLLDELNASLP